MDLPKRDHKYLWTFGALTNGSSNIWILKTCTFKVVDLERSGPGYCISKSLTYERLWVRSMLITSIGSLNKIFPMFFVDKGRIASPISWNYYMTSPRKKCLPLALHCVLVCVALRHIVVVCGGIALCLCDCAVLCCIVRHLCSTCICAHMWGICIFCWWRLFPSAVLLKQFAT